MKAWKKFIYRHMLFIKIFLVVICSISLVTILITFSSIRIASNLFIETSSITNAKVLNQIKDRFQTYTHSISSSKTKIEADGTLEEVLKEDNTTAKERSHYYYHMIDRMSAVYNEIESNNINMIIASPQSDIFNMNYFNWSVDSEDLLTHNITKESAEKPDEILYHFADSPLTNHVPMLVATKALVDNNRHIYGYLYLSVHEKEIRKYYEGFTSTDNHVLLLSSEGQVMSSSKPDILGTYYPHLLQQVTEQNDPQDERKIIKLDNEEFILLYEYLPFMDMYLVNIINQTMLRENVVDASEIILLSIIIVIIAVLLTFFILKRMTNSVSKIVYQISDMKRYQFNKPLQESGGYEARKIATAFNYMLEELQDYVSILLKTQEKQQRTELELLQYQINPHFIYNTLASIKFLIKQNKNTAALTTIDSFISLLQNNLSNMNDMVTVEQELETIESYVHITQARYGEQVRVNYLVSPDCLPLRLPKLILQPFIENAFFHGFTKKKQGIIQVLISKQHNKLICEIIDNGDGIPESRINNLDQKKKLFKGLGIKNVHNRIQLQFGRKYGVEVESKQMEGTKIRITLPVIS